LFAWAEATVAKLSAKSALAAAFRYTINRRAALSRFVTDQQFSMRLSRGRVAGGESGMQQSAVNQSAAAKSGFARARESDS